ncbi:MAG: DsbA family oxidoreductase [Pseudomonadota bacterium]
MLTIDVISDTVCPWCFIGKRRLGQALDEETRGIVVRWRPFALNPDMPRQGRDRAAHYRAKFGDERRIAALTRNLAAEGEKLGIAFAFDAIKRVPNTTDSHRLILWAASAGVQDLVVEALFKAYFEEARDIGEVEVLTEIADKAGMDGALVAELFASDRDIDLVQKEIQAAANIGVTGVPTFIFAGRLAAVGAQPKEVLTAAIAQAAQLSAAQ